MAELKLQAVAVLMRLAALESPRPSVCLTTKGLQVDLEGQLWEHGSLAQTEA